MAGLMMRISPIWLLIWMLALGVRILPIDQASVFFSGIFLSEATSDAGEAEDKEWEASPKVRHIDLHAIGRDVFPSTLSRKGLGHRSADRIGDRGADDIPTPPPNACS